MYFKPIVDLRADLKAKLEKAQENQCNFRLLLL